jgi:hypothetical protein
VSLWCIALDNGCNKGDGDEVGSGVTWDKTGFVCLGFAGEGVLGQRACVHQAKVTSLAGLRRMRGVAVEFA